MSLEPGDFAVLRVVDLNRVGAFLDSGDIKDLLLPFAEQTKTLRIGQDILVFAYIDNTQRLCASMRIERGIDTSMPDLTQGSEVDLIIASQSDLGFKAIVNGRWLGLLYADEVFQPLSYAQEIRGWVKKVRDDGKIDLQLTDPLVIGHHSADPIADQILERLTASEKGFLPINDKTPAEDIYEWFGVSRKKFKIALGGLYKRRLITVEEDGIRLVAKAP
jgi:predicted RNA-binding protein (virulence factor B family)